jgi:hypothetical protein
LHLSQERSRKRDSARSGSRHGNQRCKLKDSGKETKGIAERRSPQFIPLLDPILEELAREGRIGVDGEGDNTYFINILIIFYLLKIPQNRFSPTLWISFTLLNIIQPLWDKWPRKMIKRDGDPGVKEV